MHSFTPGGIGYASGKLPKNRLPVQMLPNLLRTCQRERRDDKSARSIGLQKEHHYVVWVDTCFAKLLDQRGNKTFFRLVSVPEDTSTSIINIWSERGLGSAG
jgi:hypothetical protein